MHRNQNMPNLRCNSFKDTPCVSGHHSENEQGNIELVGANSETTLGKIVLNRVPQIHQELTHLIVSESFLAALLSSRRP